MSDDFRAEMERITSEEETNKNHIMLKKTELDIIDIIDDDIDADLEFYESKEET